MKTILKLFVCVLFASPASAAPMEDTDFEHPLLVQAAQAQSERDYETAQRLFDRYLAELPEKERRVFRDLKYDALPQDVKLVEDAPQSDREALEDRFWRRMDPSPLTRANERLVEHYRRVAYARQHFGQGRFPWDDRGDVYVRFGPPDHVSRSGDMQIEMDPAIQDARVNFVNRKRLALQITPGQPIFPVPANTRWAYWVYADLEGGTEFDFVSRFKRTVYDFATMPDGLSVSLMSDLLAYQGAMILKDLSSRTPAVYDVDFADLPIDFFYYPAGFRGSDGKTRLEIYYGLPASEMSRLPIDETTDRIMLDRGLALFDSLWTEVYRIGDQLTFSAPSQAQVMEGAFIPGVLTFEVEPGQHYLSFQVRDVVSGKSQVYQQALAVEDFADRDALLMSDIELAFWIAPTEEEGPFVKNGINVVPMASRAFRARQTAFVFFEIYNLARDAFGQTKYRVEYTFRAKEKGSVPIRALRGLGRVLRLKDRAKEVSIAYEQTGDTPDDMAYVELDLAESQPGGQEVRVAVTDLLSDREVGKEIVFDIVP